ncbi:MAG: MmgE/PrpD family protein [Rhodospirillales bacterium]|nr:MmgE/PrpD family protein [Rhodospirillales bacterium]
MVQVTKILAEFAHGLSYETLPAAVRSRSKQLILDLAGNIIRARHDAESSPSLVAAMMGLGYGNGDCTVLGDSHGYTPPGAAMLNGALAHSLDFDDTHAAGSIHAGAPIIPAAFAVAEQQGAAGRDVIAAIVAGYEIQIRLSLALGPSDHYDRGFHPTATCGIFGATAAAGKLLGLDAAGLASAFGVALSQAAGSMQFLHEGGWTKRSHVGQAAMNGVIAATLAAEGFRGAVDAFEGQVGFLHAYAPAADHARAIADLGGVWETLNVAVKPYPSCRYSHAPLDALIALRAAHQINPQEITRVTVGVSKTGWKIIGDPEITKQHPKSVVDGQFSMPFCAAVALRTGGLGWDDYRRHLTDPETLALCARIETGVDPKADAAFPATMAGRVVIETKSGQYEAYVETPKGEPANFVTDDELLGKFDGLAGPYLGQAALKELSSGLLGLDQVEDVGALLHLSRRSQTMALAGE